MEYRHTPVLLAEVTQQLSPQPGSIIVDCTLGGAGHAKRLQDLVAPGGILVGMEDVIAALISAILVAALALFFQKTGTGRALRAVADDLTDALT